MKNVIGGWNTDKDGNSRTIKANYYKVSFSNAAHNDGCGATFVLEEWYEQDNQGNR